MLETEQYFPCQHVLIVEDHPMVADALQALLQKLNPALHCVICHSARDAQQKLAASDSWRMIYLDLDVPGAHGLSLARQLAQRGLAARCVVLSAHEHGQWQAEACAMGLLGYICKGWALPEYLRAIEDTLAGRRCFAAGVAQNAPPPTRLTRRQQDVLCLLQRGYSSKQIASQLGLNTGTVDNHVTGLLRALNASSRTHAIAKAIGLGYLRISDMPAA
ncbi:response regulator transcription factor [Massilia sp. W12]|uniref:response regulator transcription factor n=1 Tax=Massilia sp. W12 TaxID=3126507 RepID=UPI0030CCCB6E